MQKMNFLLVEDEALIRDGLRALLEKENFVRGIYEASNLRQFVEQMTMNIDIVLLDIRLPGTSGLELISYLKRERYRARVIVLTGLEGTELILNLLKSGVHGIVYKLSGYEEIIKTIKGVTATGNYFSERVMEIIRANAHKLDLVPPVVLNLHENELLRALASGLTTKEISSALKITVATAETYRTRLIKKVGVHNTAGLVAYAFRNGIL